MRVMLALSRHRFQEALDVLSDALRTDPLAPWLHARVAWALHLAGRACDAKEQVEYCVVNFTRQESTNFYGSQILAFTGEPERAIGLSHELVERSSYFDLSSAVEAYAQVKAGNRVAARAILDRLQWQSRDRFVLRSFLPVVHLALGNIEGAIEDLRASEAAGCPWFSQLLADPRIKDLAGHPEYERMLADHRALELQAASI